jgi:hypothetical protein
MLRKSLVIAFVMAAFSIATHAAGVDKDNLKEYGRGIIKDYSDMNSGDGVEWLWQRPGLRLSEHRFELKTFENLTAVTDADMEETFRKGIPRTLEGAGSKDSTAPLLLVEGAIYWAQRANKSKRFIPIAGGHLAQAGVGIELVIRDDKGDIVCKIRHSGREGSQLKNAAEELIDEISRFVGEN